MSLGLVSASDQFRNGLPTGVQTVQATISDNTSVALRAKDQVERLRLYAGYEWIQFANASDTITSFTDIAGDTVTGQVSWVVMVWRLPKSSGQLTQRRK